MAAASDYLENQMVDHVFRSATFTKPTQLHVGLFTSATADDGTGTEVTGGSYARVALNPSDTNWSATQGGTTGASSGTSGNTNNAVEISFPQATANWGTVTHFAVFDLAAAGNMIVHGALTSSKTVNSGDTFRFPVNDLNVTIA